jgi:hypothetical protein
MTEHENSPSKQLRGAGLAQVPWPANKAIIRIVAIVQLLFTLYRFVATPFVFNYGGAAANPVGFQLWIIFWLGGIVSASCLLTAHLWARVFALLWNVADRAEPC